LIREIGFVLTILHHGDTKGTEKETGHAGKNERVWGRKKRKKPKKGTELVSSVGLPLAVSFVVLGYG
jgi:hypothetical protein